MTKIMALMRACDRERGQCHRQPSHRSRNFKIAALKAGSKTDLNLPAAHVLNDFGFGEFAPEAGCCILGRHDS
jgi:hypothetical protein